MEEAVPDFTNKVVLFYLSYASSLTAEGLVLESATFQRYGDRLFVVGRAAHIPHSMWSAGVRAEVAWDCVSSYLVFDSLDDYINRVSSYKPALLERIRRFF